MTGNRREKRMSDRVWSERVYQTEGKYPSFCAVSTIKLFLVLPYCGTYAPTVVYRPSILSEERQPM
jgi:hypothetical protein